MAFEEKSTKEFYRQFKKSHEAQWVHILKKVTDWDNAPDKLPENSETVDTIEDLLKMSPEEILLRWVNYHLEKVKILWGAEKLSFEGCIEMKKMVKTMIFFRLERTSE